MNIKWESKPLNNISFYFTSSIMNKSIFFNNTLNVYRLKDNLRTQFELIQKIIQHK